MNKYEIIGIVGDGGSDVRDDDDVCGDVDFTDGDGDRDVRDGDDDCGAVGATGGDGDNDDLDDDDVCVNATDGVNGSSTGGNGDSNSDGDACVSGVGDGGADDAVLIVP